jgi:hypothetical protein
MKFLPMRKEVYQGKLKFKGKWKRRLYMFIAVNLISFILLPQLFFGFWGTVQGIGQGIARQRYLYEVERKHGRTVKDLVECIDIWKSVPAAVNPLNWSK